MTCVFVLQLDEHKNLTTQCVQGSGMVQINVEVKSRPGERARLNIVDILKPAEEEVEMQATLAPPSPVPPPPPPITVRASGNKKLVIPFPEASENVTRWVIDQKFRSEQLRLNIPLGKTIHQDPNVNEVNSS